MKQRKSATGMAGANRTNKNDLETILERAREEDIAAMSMS
jgi:hypothetical protein